VAMTPLPKRSIPKNKWQRAAVSKEQKKAPLVREIRWNGRHQLNGFDNAMLPKGKRQFFGRAQSEPELEALLTRDARQRPQFQNLLDRLQGPPTPRERASKLSTDCFSPYLPARDEFHVGTMTDKKGRVTEWNGRHAFGPHNHSQRMHRSTCEYFSTPSLFATAPSQQWRRCCDYQDASGFWHEGSGGRVVKS